MIPLIVYGLKLAGETQAAWFDEKFGFRQRVDITNAGSTQTDFQVSFVLNTDTLYDDGKLKADCSDIRVTDINGKQLPFWIESMSTSCGNGQTAQIIWVKVPSISTTGNTLYVYYGNPSATSLSDGNKVFEFFDDFSGSAVNESKWTTGTIAATSGTNWSVSGGNLVGGNNNRYIQSVKNFTGDYAVQTRSYTTTDNVNGFSVVGFYESSTNSVGLLDHNNTSYYRDDADWVNFSYDGTGAWIKNFVQVIGTTGYCSRGITSCAISFTNSGISGEYVRLGARYDDTGFDQNYDALWDWVFVRKAASTLPTVGDPTSEENGPGPVGYWKFDEGTGTTANDSTSSRNNGALANMSATPATNSGWMSEDNCIKGKCLAFDGGNDYVDMGTSSKYDFTSAFTVSAWIYRSSTQLAPDSAIISKMSNSPYNGYGLLYSGTHTVDLYMDGAYRADSTTVIPANTWTYVVGVWDGTNAKIYINGKLDKSSAYSIAPTSSGQPLFIGKYSTNLQRSFTGRIDEPQIYKYARSAAQIKEDYNQSSGSVLGATDANRNLTNGLVGYWKMDEASWTGDCSTSVVLDSSGNNNNGKACPDTDSMATSTSSAKFGRAGNFNGTGSYIATINNTLASADDFTIATWFKTNSTNYASHIIWQGEAAGNGFGTHQEMHITVGGARSGVTYNDRLSFFLGDATNYENGGDDLYTETSFTDTSSWHHVVIAVRDGNNASMYVDGVLVDTDTSNTISRSSWDTNLQIGKPGAAMRYFNGNIDEARVYNRALTSREAEQLYNFAPGPVHYWNMDERVGTTLTDRAGGNTATFSGNTVFASGKYGAGLKFDGDSDYAVAGSVPSISPTGSFTYQTWIKVNSYQNGALTDGAGTYFIDRGGIPGSPLVSLKPVSDRYGYQTRNDDGTGLGGPTGGKIILNQWQHIAMVRDYGNSFKLYVDGILVGSTSDSLPKALTPPRPKLGGHAVACNCLDGVMDDFKIYNYARTPGQIVADMNGGHPAPGSPVGSALVHLKFDDGRGNVASNSGNIATMSAGLYNMARPATVNSGWSQNGKFGKALSFDGVDDYVGIPDNSGIDTGNAWTVSAWVNPTVSVLSGSDRNEILSKAENATGLKINYELALSTAGKFNASVSKSTCDTGGQTVTGTTIAQPKKWYHAVATFDGATGNLKIYVNGRLEATLATGYSGACENAGNASIGRFDFPWSIYKDEFLGLIDEVKIYNSALSDSQVKLEYNRGSSMVLGSLSDTSQLAGGSVASNSASAEYCVPGASDSCAGPVARWDFEEGSGTVANDKSGNEINGTLTNGASWTSGKIGKAINFDGSNDFVDIGANSIARNVSVLTISAWFKPTTLTPPTTANIFETSINNGGVPATNSRAFMDMTTTGQIIAGGRSTDAEGGQSVTTTNSGIRVNTWHYATAVINYATDTIDIYVDGVKKSTTGTPNFSASSTPDDNSSAGAIGSQETGVGAFFYGSIDQVRVYQYARTPAQVAWDYNKGLPIGHWKFDECQGAVINSSVGTSSALLIIGAGGTQTSPGTCSTASTAWGNGVTGKLNRSINFDGTDDYVTLGDAEILQPTRVSVGAWFKTTASGNSVIVRKRTYGYNLGLSSGAVFFNIVNSVPTSFQATSSRTNYNDGNWHYALGTYDGSTVKIYVDGILAGSAAAGTIHYQGGGVAVGRDGDFSGSYFTGQIDDVKIFNYPLTTSQVRVNFNNGAVNFGPATGAP